MHHNIGGDEAEHRETDPEREGEPHAGDPVFGGTPFVAGAEVTRHDCGGAVGQEVEDTERGGEHRAGDTEPAELMRAEMPDDRRIGEDVQGLGDQRAECRHREPQNLPIPRIHPHRETLEPRQSTATPRAE